MLVSKQKIHWFLFCFKLNLYCKLALRVPSKVASVFLSKTIEKGTPALNVIWNTPPPSNLTILQYKVQFRKSRIPDAGTEHTISAPVTSVVLSGLMAGTEYNVIVLAVFLEIGDGNWSDVATSTTFRSGFFSY